MYIYVQRVYLRNNLKCLNKDHYLSKIQCTLFFLFYSNVDSVLFISELYLQDNKFTVLPDEIRDMEELKVIDLSCNKFEDFPSILCDCPKLKTVILRDNKIKGLSHLLFSISIM